MLCFCFCSQVCGKISHVDTKLINFPRLKTFDDIAFSKRNTICFMCFPSRYIFQTNVLDQKFFSYHSFVSAGVWALTLPPNHFWPDLFVTSKNDPKPFSIHINKSFRPKNKKIDWGPEKISHFLRFFHLFSLSPAKYGCFHLFSARFCHQKWSSTSPRWSSWTMCKQRGSTGSLVLKCGLVLVGRATIRITARRLIMPSSTGFLFLNHCILI